MHMSTVATVWRALQPTLSIKVVPPRQYTAMRGEGCFKVSLDGSQRMPIETSSSKARACSGC